MKNLHPYVEHGLINYDKIKIDEIHDTVVNVLSEAKEEIDKLSKSNKKLTWDNFILPMDELTDYVHKIINPIQHLASVNDSKEIRDAYSACIPALTEYGIFISQNKRLYNKFISFRDDGTFSSLSNEQQRSVTESIRNFELGGVDLEGTDKKRYKKISEKLSLLSNEFQNNCNDAKNAWTKHITDINELEGLPESNLSILKEAAIEKELDGWLITLDYPNLSSILDYASNRELRKEIQYASMTKASDIGPYANKFNNMPIMEEIIALKYELSSIMEYANPAEQSVDTKMAESASEVFDFLDDIINRSTKGAILDKKELDDYGINILGYSSVHGYDHSYIHELIRKEKYELDETLIREYFPVDSVIKGLFKLVQTLFGIGIVRRNEVPIWHKSVTYYDIYRDGTHIASFYFDLFTRSEKRSGAWMNDAQTRFKMSNGLIQKPIAYLNCNFSPPTSELPSLLTHRDIETLFHEFGHGLHHMLTQVETYDVSGINGVEWDAVEQPSQIMENWCWNYDVIQMISSHHKTHDTLPKDLFDKMLAAKNFYSGAALFRQASMSLLDMKFHTLYKTNNTLIDIIREHEKAITVFGRNPDSRWENTFAHIFAGGYSAGYYSYLYSEILSADAFSAFEEDGILNPEVGARFRECILEKGSTKPAMDLFVDFRGRKPTSDALLRHRGII